MSPYPWLTLYGLSVGLQFVGESPWLACVPQIVQCENCQPALGVAFKLRELASANAYVPSGGLVVPPAEDKITTTAAVLSQLAGTFQELQMGQ